MKILHAIFAILSAVIVGFCIQSAIANEGFKQLLYISGATINAGYCFWHINKFMEDEE